MKDRLIATVALCAMFVVCPVAAQVQGAWSTTGTLPSVVEFNTQVLLSNGSVLVAGAPTERITSPLRSFTRVRDL